MHTYTQVNLHTSSMGEAKLSVRRQREPTFRASGPGQTYKPIWMARFSQFRFKLLYRLKCLIFPVFPYYTYENVNSRCFRLKGIVTHILYLRKRQFEMFSTQRHRHTYYVSQNPSMQACVNICFAISGQNRFPLYSVRLKN